MPSLTDLFNPTFLIFLGILMLVAALIVVYFESRMREQNHKIASMLSLVSSLAEELNGVKFGLNHLSMRGGSIPPAFVQQNHLAQNLNNSLIAVSDDDSGSDDDEEEESISDEESVSDEEDESISDEEEESISNEEFNNGTDLKVFKLNISSHDNDNFETEDIDNFETEELNDDQSLSGNSSITSVNKTSELIVSEFINETHNNETHNNENNNNEENVISQTEFKTININLEEHIDTLDYKKLQLAKLRSIVTETGLSIDSNKLKKNELLKLLGAE